MSNRFQRQQDTLPLNKSAGHVLIFGAGSIGSFTAMALAKMGVEPITVADFDVVEAENLNAQVYSEEHVGKLKVEALKEFISKSCDADISIHDKKFNGDTEDFYRDIRPDIVISAVDCMSARRHIVHTFSDISYIIDPRMAIENLSIFTLPDGRSKPDLARFARTMMYSNDEAKSAPNTPNTCLLYTSPSPRDS